MNDFSMAHWLPTLNFLLGGKDHFFVYLVLRLNFLRHQLPGTRKTGRDAQVQIPLIKYDHAP